MKIFKEIKNKKDLLKELRFYKEIIIKKLEKEDLNSALNKSRSALTLIKEYQDRFDLTNILAEFHDLNQKITTEMMEHRNFYIHRLHNLLKEKVNESTLENQMKLLAMLKSKVDRVSDKYNLEDVQGDINRYFSFIKKLYVILSTYETLNYSAISETIYNFKKDLDSENFPNLRDLIESISLKVFTRRLKELGEKYKKISIPTLSEEMQLNEDDLLDLVLFILEIPNGPIKVYNSTLREIIFLKEE
ncbi:MAG: hypothetical protein ACTSR8_20320 [Promethearchaeota archaeon]